MKTGLNKYEILEVELELTGECKLNRFSYYYLSM
jgi:hypothetical protein